MKIKSQCLIIILFGIMVWPALAYDKAIEIEKFVSEFHNIKEFNGTVLVSQNNKVIFEKAYGFANFEWDIKNTLDTKFRIASLTKQFTAMLIMQLVEENVLKLDAPISEYLKDFRKDIGDKVTIHHLLNHTSGIPNYLRIKNFRKDISRNNYSVAEFIKKFCSDDLDFEPGSDFRYSNSGYFILGSIIEKVTKKTYENVLRENILDPLGMKNTGYDNSSVIIKNRASGYDKTLNGYVNTGYLDMSIPYAAGSMYSTVRDLSLWDNALYTESLLSVNSIKKMFKVSKHRNYAYGWEVNEIPTSGLGQKITSINHGGGINGFNSSITRILQDKYLIVLLNNGGGAPMRALNKGITNILYGKPYQLAQQRLNNILYDLIVNEGIASALQKYNKLNEQGKGFSERGLNHFGYELLNLNLTEAAIEIFKLNVVNNPESANAYDSLAEGYLSIKNNTLALSNYKKSLALNKENENAKQAIKKLKALL
ncbi:beta-lactamase family protein [Pseudoalteromonas sp. C2R02]|uniref:serine hydrolase domain-containing protein n=1 Tax=Pseudoalteromonas sp. C2R02 TaxID=2841565 RepID=UPI001C0806C2|nr:serine hydrolase domain-containing protein [Pseudoalteromonas sp. C2R02]MBU2971020.1 beta-lactamase family protein [Pseudoalteromonas sp. C2R02]